MRISELLPFVLLAGAFWLLIMRPAQRQRAAKAALLQALQPGAHVITSGGIHGTVVSLTDDDVVLEVSDGVQMRFVRSAVSAVRDDHADQDDADQDDAEETHAEPGDPESAGAGEPDQPDEPSTT